MTRFVSIGNKAGWMLDDENKISEQEQKVDKVLYLSERALQTLEKIVGIYSKFRNPEAFETFQNQVDEIMKKGSYQNYFNDENYKKNSDQS